MNSNPEKFLFTITTYDADPDRAATPFVLANAALAGGADVLLWLTVDGANFGRRGAADGLAPKSFPPIDQLLQAFVQAGGRIGICPPCGKTHGVTDENMVDSGEWMGAAAVVDAARERRTLSF